MLNDAVRALLAITAFTVFVPGAVAAQSGSLSGSVLSSPAEKPIANAEIIFADLKRSVRTDSAGKFVVSDVPNGTHEVTVRHLGFEPFIAKLTFRKSENIDADFVLNTLTTLERVDVMGEVKKRYASRLADFESRRKMGMGKFLPSEYFEKNSVLSWSAILSQQFGNLRTNRLNGSEVAVTNRGATGPHGCPVQVMLNGLTVFNGESILFDISILQPSTIIGVEYYTPLFTPAEFQKRPRGGAGGSGCGTLLIWTK